MCPKCPREIPQSQAWSAAGRSLAACGTAAVGLQSTCPFSGLQADVDACPVLDVLVDSVSVAHEGVPRAHKRMVLVRPSQRKHHAQVGGGAKFLRGEQFINHQFIILRVADDGVTPTNR